MMKRLETNPERLRWIREEFSQLKESGKITIGKNVNIHPFVALGESGFTMERGEDGCWVEGENLGNIIIEDDVKIGEFTTIKRATLPDASTTIGKDTKIRNHVNIGHNCRIGKHNFIGPHVCFNGSSEIGDRCWVAPHVVVEEHVKIGSDVIIGMGAVVTEDVPDGETVVGIPAIPIEYHGNYVHPSFKHGKNFKIGKYCHIHEDVEVGDNVKLRSYIELRPKTRIGNGCYIDSGVKSSGQNKIGNNVTLRYDAIIARGAIVHDDVFISPQLMTENVDHHGNQIGGAEIGVGDWDREKTKYRVFIGTNVTLASGIKICSGAIIGSKANVRKDILEPGVYIGNPARKMDCLR